MRCHITGVMSLSKQSHFFVILISPLQRPKKLFYSFLLLRELHLMTVAVRPAGNVHRRFYCVLCYFAAQLLVCIKIMLKVIPFDFL